MNEELYQRRIHRLMSVLEVSKLISSTLKLGEVIERIMESAKTVMEAEASSLLLVDDKTGDLVFMTATGAVGDQVKDVFRLPQGQGVAGWVALHQQPVSIPNAYEDDRFNPEVDRQTGFHTQSILCVPLMMQTELIGVAQVINRQQQLPDGTVTVIPFDQDDLMLFQSFCSNAAVAVANAKLHSQLVRDAKREYDMNLAQTIQQSFLPSPPFKMPGYEVFMTNTSALEIGGDFFDFYCLDDEHYLITIGDVVGKGASAALYMARLTSDLRYLALDLGNPKDIAFNLNQMMVGRGSEYMFATAIIAVVHASSGVMNWVKAGHPDPVCKHADGTVSTLASTNNPPLGIAPCLEFEVSLTQLQHGDLVYMFTDGIIEAQNESRTLFGMQRLLDAVADGPDQPEQLHAHILTNISKHQVTADASDDITAVVFKRE